MLLAETPGSSSNYVSYTHTPKSLQYSEASSIHGHGGLPSSRGFIVAQPLFVAVHGDEGRLAHSRLPDYYHFED